MPQPGEPIIFTANVQNFDEEKIIYNWTLKGGKIINGQGTQTITVEMPARSFESLTATVEVKGLPEGCANIASETTSGDPPPEAAKIDEFSGSISKIEKTRIDSIVKRVEYDPNAQLFILIGTKKTSSTQTIIKREREISKIFVAENAIPAERITIIKVVSEENIVQFWLVPAGATPPDGEEIKD